MAAGLGLLGATSASAHSNTHKSIVEKLASRFNVSEEDVQAVFDEERAQRNAEMTQLMSENLQKKVDAGDITLEQKALIEEKLASIREEMEANREAGNTRSHKEMREQMKQKHAELEVWAEENNIPTDLLRELRPNYGKHGQGGRHQF